MHVFLNTLQTLGFYSSPGRKSCSLEGLEARSPCWSSFRCRSHCWVCRAWRAPGSVCTRLAPSQGNLGWGMALREGSCLAGEKVTVGGVQTCYGAGRASLPASTVAAFLLFSLSLQKGQCFFLNSLFFSVFFKEH